MDQALSQVQNMGHQSNARSAKADPLRMDITS